MISIILIISIYCNINITFQRKSYITFKGTRETNIKTKMIILKLPRTYHDHKFKICWALTNTIYVKFVALNSILKTIINQYVPRC